MNKIIAFMISFFLISFSSWANQSRELNPIDYNQEVLFSVDTDHEEHVSTISRHYRNQKKQAGEITDRYDYLNVWNFRFFKNDSDECVAEVSYRRSSGFSLLVNRKSRSCGRALKKLLKRLEQ